MDLNEERLFKIKKIEELYAQRNTQEFVAKTYMMDISDVGKVLKLLNYSYTRKKDHKNLKPRELIKPIIKLDEFGLLDGYDLDNFK